jgi:hypothetical protein
MLILTLVGPPSTTAQGSSRNASNVVSFMVPVRFRQESQIVRVIRVKELLPENRFCGDLSCVNLICSQVFDLARRKRSKKRPSFRDVFAKFCDKLFLIRPF